LLVGAITLYQRFVSPWLPAACRFYPSCSEYAIQAIRAHGAVRGAWMGFLRLMRCQPFSRGGYDPVPEPRDTGRPQRSSCC
jgi:putative membrane protein insertion efficiency factor